MDGHTLRLAGRQGPTPVSGRRDLVEYGFDGLVPERAAPEGHRVLAQLGGDLVDDDLLRGAHGPGVHRPPGSERHRQLDRA